jgi:hypothetical protein
MCQGAKVLDSAASHVLLARAFRFRLAVASTRLTTWFHAAPWHPGTQAP